MTEVVAYKDIQSGGKNTASKRGYKSDSLRGTETRE